MKIKITHAHNPNRIILIGEKYTIVAQQDETDLISVSLTRTTNRAISNILIHEKYAYMPFSTAIRNFMFSNTIKRL